MVVIQNTAITSSNCTFCSLSTPVVAIQSQHFPPNDHSITQYMVLPPKALPSCASYPTFQLHAVKCRVAVFMWVELTQLTTRQTAIALNAFHWIFWIKVSHWRICATIITAFLWKLQLYFFSAAICAACNLFCAGLTFLRSPDQDRAAWQRYYYW